MATILIVDDRPTNRELFVTLLGYGGGHRLLEAAEGEEGLVIARAERPDLIITDIVMPTMDGYEFAHQVRADPAISKTQIIFYTSSSIVAETRRLAAACGVSTVIGKPIEPQALLDSVQAALDSRQTPVIPPNSEEFHREHMRLLTDTLAKKVDELEAEISERKRAEEELHKSEETYRFLFENNPLPMWVYDLETLAFLAVNDSAVEKYGYTREEFLRMTIADIRPMEEVSRLMEDVSKQRPPLQHAGEWRHRLKDGTIIDVEITSHTLQMGEHDAALVVAQDITERKRAADQLNYHARLLRHISDAVIATDDQFHITAWNRAAEKMYGWTSKEVMGQNASEILSFGLTDEQQTEAREVLKESMASRSEGIYHRRDGRTIYVEANTIALTDEHGKMTGYVSVNRDITERKQAEEQIWLQLQRLKALRAIDIAISSSFNLGLTLDILLDQVLAQLKTDAAAILLFHPITRTLEYGASRGFRSMAVREARVKLGEGYAGKAILERRILHIPNLMGTDSELAEALSLKSEEFMDYYCVPLLVKGEIQGVLEIFHRSARGDSAEWLDFLETLAGQASIAIENATLFENLQHSNNELFQAYDATIEGWSHALDLRDKETEGHSLRVTEMTLELARKFGFPDEQLIYIRWGALLHDIGKMGIPDSILLKPDKLTDQEWESMKKHPVFAFEMLSPITYLKSSLDIPYCHHEKWDGTGYPRGLKGEVIPLAARLFAIVDVWDALRSDRPYRLAWSKEKVLEHIRSLSGTHFDPKVTEYFLEMIEQQNG